MTARTAAVRQRMVPRVQEQVAADVGGRDGAGWGAAHRCGNVVGVAVASATASPMACDQASETSIREKKTVMEVRWTGESRVLTFSSRDDCTGPRLRASAILTWAAMLGLTRNGTTTMMADVPWSTGGEYKDAYRKSVCLAEIGAGWAEKSRARPAKLQWLAD